MPITRRPKNVFWEKPYRTSLILDSSRTLAMNRCEQSFFPGLDGMRIGLIHPSADPNHEPAEHRKNSISAAPQLVPEIHLRFPADHRGDEQHQQARCETDAEGDVGNHEIGRQLVVREPIFFAHA